MGLVAGCSGALGAVEEMKCPVAPVSRISEGEARVIEAVGNCGTGLLDTIT